MSTSRFTQTLRHSLSVLLASLLLLTLLPSVALADSVLYVDFLSGSDTTGNGTVNSPYQSITKAMSSLTVGTIYVAPGMYNTSTETFPIVVKPGVAVIGTGGAADTIVSAVDTTETIQIFNATAGTRVEGLKITGGNGDGEAGALRIQVEGGTSATGWPKIVDCEISGNLAGSNMCNGIYIEGVSDTAAPTIQDCIISNNHSTVGGGVMTYGDTAATLVDCVIADNVSASTGGGLFSYGPNSTMTLTDCEISGNQALHGGAVWTDLNYSTFTMTGGSVHDNDASQDGGGFAINDGSLAIEGVEIYSNTAGGYGGGVWTVYKAETMHITDTAFWDNHATTDGAALALRNPADVVITHSSIFGSTGSSAVDFNNGTLNVYNSILWNTLGNDFNAPPTTIQYSCVEQAGITGTGVIHTDPQMIDTANGDHRLKLGSPCIDMAGTTESDGDDIAGAVRPQDGNGDGSEVPDMGCWERPPADVARNAGSDRYSTAAVAATEAFDSADTVIIASGQNFPDALSAAGLCGTYRAPLLLTRTASLPPATAQALTDLGVTDVVIVGGTGAVSSAVETALKVDYNVTRIFGADRYSTAAKVAEEIESIQGAEFNQWAFIARGDAFPDALAVSPYSYDEGTPILLTRPTSLPPATKVALEDLDIEDAIIPGGEGAVSGTVKIAIDAVIIDNGGSASLRLAGADRYSTAATIASHARTNEWGDPAYVGIATGANFPDALAGGVATGVRDGSVLLTRETALPSATSAELTTRGPKTVWCEIFGGTGVVSDSVRDSIQTALGW